jgi:type II secretory pathway component PulM
MRVAFQNQCAGRGFLRCILTIITIGAAACGSGAGRDLDVTRIASPAAPGSAQPQLTVMGDRAVLSWVERTDRTATLKFAERTATGWSEPRTVAFGDDWFVNWADVPSVVRLADGSMAAHWLQKSGPGTYAYDVRISFSTDDGRSWSAPVTPHKDGTQTEHGFASLFQTPGSGLGLVWLDGRAMSSGGHEGHAGGAMTLRAATVQPDGSQHVETSVDDRVCECCPTAAAVTSEGPIAAFRNRGEDEVRDIHVSRLVDGRWTESTPVHRDNWRIPACPVNGPAISARDRRVAVAWFTMDGSEGRAFLAFSDDAGRTFGPRIRVDDVGTLGRVDVDLQDDGSAVVSWIEFAEQRASMRVRRVDTGGKPGPAVTVTELNSGRSSGYPRLARRGKELLLAWTATTGTPQVQTAVINMQ